MRLFRPMLILSGFEQPKPTWLRYNTQSIFSLIFVFKIQYAQPFLQKKRAAKLASISELIQPALYSAVYCAPVGKSSVNFLENDRFPVHIFRGLSWPFGNGNRRTQHSQSASPLLSSAPRRPIANAVLSGGLSALRP